MKKLVEPNGEKVRELRSAKGLLQKVLAAQVNISVRTLRYIENNNKPIPEFQLVELAQKLGVAPETIQPVKVQSSVVSFKRQSSIDPYQVQLRVIEDARSIIELCNAADRCTWTLDVDPNRETAPLMEEMLKLVNRITMGRSEWNMDSYDTNHTYHDIFRYVRIKEIIDELSLNKVRILANTYDYRFKNEEGSVISEKYIYVTFGNCSSDSIMKWIDPGIIIKPPVKPSFDEFLDDDDELPF